MPYLLHDFYNSNFKIEHTFYIASGSVTTTPPPPPAKHSGCAPAGSVLILMAVRLVNVTVIYAISFSDARRERENLGLAACLWLLLELK
jgi:hypothetical protein